MRHFGQCSRRLQLQLVGLQPRFEVCKCRIDRAASANANATALLVANNKRQIARQLFNAHLVLRGQSIGQRASSGGQLSQRVRLDTGREARASQRHDDFALTHTAQR